MGQQLFKVDFQRIASNESPLSSTDISSDNEQENIHFFFPAETDETTASDTESLFIDKIRQSLFRLTHANELEQIDAEINHILVDEILPPVNEYYEKAIKKLQFDLENQHQFYASLTNKFQGDEDDNQPVIDESVEDEPGNEQVSSFAIQSFASIVLLLIKSAEKTDPTIVQQIVTLTSQLCEKLPMVSSSALSDSSLLFRSLQPARDFFHELLLRNDPIVAKAATKILLNFAIAQSSFKEMLPLLARLMFDTETVYDIRRLFLQLNKALITTMKLQGQETNAEATSKEIKDEAVEFLKSTGVYPSTQLMQLDKKVFTGQFICSVILTHIDIDYQLRSSVQLSHDLVHPKTFETLFGIIAQLTTALKENSNPLLTYMLTVCLRLFTTHMTYLSAMQVNLYRDLLATNDVIRKSLSQFSNNTFDLSRFINQERLIEWFQLFLNLSHDQNHTSAETKISKEASKAIVCLLDLRMPSFTEKLSFMHRYLVKNQYPILTNQLMIEWNKNETLLCWIEILRDDNKNEAEKTTAFKILDSLIEISSNPSKQMNKEHIEQVEKLLLLFQQLLIGQLLLPAGDDAIDRSIVVPSSVATQYLACLFRHHSRTTESNLFSSALVGLCLMTTTDQLFDLTTVQPIFAAILPLLADYVLESLTQGDVISNHQNLLAWLMGKMAFVLISGSSLDSFEIKQAEKLDLPIFAGGYENPTAEKSDYLSNILKSNLSSYGQFKLKDHTEDSPLDKEFLMSVFNNMGDGADLITKMKMFIKENQYLSQKSIEGQANDLVAVVYAVYIKHFDRVSLARVEAFPMNQRRTHSQLLSIFEYANHVRTLLRTIKAEGGDCEEFCRQAKTNALFLLSYVAKSDSIPRITEETPSPAIELPPTKPHHFQRQISRWSKARHVLKLLRHLMQACIRFKKLMRKKQARQQRVDAENLLRQAIDHFIYQEKDLPVDELKKCLDRQYERAITRLITYQFIEKFMQNVGQLNYHPQVPVLLAIFLPMLRKSTLQWSYCENILATSLQLREAIRKKYFSILHTILPCLLSSKLKVSMQNLFNYLNLNYASADLIASSVSEFPEKLFPLGDVHLLQTKLLAYNWFRLFTSKLCQTIQLDKIKGKSHPILEQQRDLLFQSYIRRQLELIQTSKTEEQKHPPDHFEDLALGWFHHILAQDSPTDISSKLEKDLWINQYLLLLLRCCHFYAHVRSACATVPYIECLLNIYHQSESKVTRLLSLKILRQLILYLPNYVNDRSKDLMEKFFIEIHESIETSFSSGHLPMELVTELVYLYRTVISRRSAWQLMATNFVLGSIQSQRNDTRVASLCILGGYIDHVSLSSIVSVTIEQEMNDESPLAMVTEMNSNNADSSYCSIQYINSNQIQPMSINRLRVVVQVPPPPPRLLLLPTVNGSIDSVLDAIGHFLQYNDTESESIMFLQLKRRSISALNHLLQDHQLVEIFMAKPYVSLIAQLCVAESLTTSTDLCYLNKEFLEQYSHRLDMYQQSKSKTNDQQDLIVAALLAPVSMYNGWRPFASKAEIQMWKQGRIGNQKIKLIPFPVTAATPEIVETCGENHKFKGRISLKQEYIRGTFPTFILENVQVNEGKWYFCVKLPTTDLIQIGWATTGFTPTCDPEIGVGDDEYSWGYDGSQGVFCNNGRFRRQFNNIRWQKDDVCGCGIEIDGHHTNIKYWLNGKLLGTAFKHQENIPQSNRKCNLSPHGRATPFFPAVTLQFRAQSTNYCDMIFSPEDMQQCPLPAGYKPLLLPTLVHTENSLVAYPSHAYVVGDNAKDYFYTSRAMPLTSLLRDFVNDNHLITAFRVDDHRLILPENSDGIPLTLEKEVSSFTIAYDFQLSQPTTAEIRTITLVTTNHFSIQIPLKKPNETIRVVMLGSLKEQQIKVYWDNQSQAFQTSEFPSEITNLLTLHHLPKIAAKMQNIAVWNYSLPEEHIHRLVSYGLFYVATDYRKLQEHRNRMNTFTFTEKQFLDECLIPFDQSFDEDIWQAKKKQVDQDETKYFSNEDPSTIEFAGNKTYLVLEKPVEPWSEYTIILDVAIINCPIHGEQWSLVKLNDKSRVSVTHEGKLCLKSGHTKRESDLTLNLNEYYRLWIIVEETSCQIFINGELQIDLKAKDARFVAQSNRFYLFQETDVSKTTNNENAVRIRCQSITLLNRSTAMAEQMKNSNCSLQSLVAPPLSIIVPSLIAIGHRLESIEYVIEQFKTTKVAMIDCILREQKEHLENNTLENKDKLFLRILATLSPTIDPQKLNALAHTWKFPIHDHVADVSQFILTHWDDLQRTESMDDHSRWLCDLGVEYDLTTWIQDQSATMVKAGVVIQMRNLGRDNTESSSSSSSDDEESDGSSRSSSERPNGDQRVNSNTHGVVVCRLHDLSRESYDQLIPLENQPEATEYLQQEILSEGYTPALIRCERKLTTIYARDTLLSMIKVWSNRSTTLFPLNKFGDEDFLVRLFRLMFYHYTVTAEKIDYMSLLVTSLLKVEMKQILEQNSENKAPLLHALQKDICSQIIHFLLEPASLNETVKFVWKVLNLCLELIKDKSTMDQNQVDILLPLIFPAPLINLIFKLFLSVETHQSKIFILRLFSNLIQISNSFKLNAQIEHFLLALLREIPSNEPDMKLLRLSIMDLVFLVTEQEGQLQRVQLPQNVRDLFTTIHVINALTDPAKQTITPEQFFTKSKTLLGDGMQFSRYDFTKSSRHFDRTADLQLLDLMNKSQELNKSFADFIRILPTESVSHSTFYQKYPSLLNIPADDVLIRAKVLYQLQLQITDVLSLVDCSLLPGESFLTDQIRKAKMYLVASKKHQLLSQAIRATEVRHNHGYPMVYFDVLKAAAISEKNEKNTMFYQAYQQLYDTAPHSFRNRAKQIWRAQYLNMHSTDQGGPYRDSITQICSDICSTRLPLFILCPNGRTNSASNQDCWIPNVFPPNRSIPETLKRQYRFVGQIMGLAVRKKHYLNVKFPLLLWKELLCEPVTIDDIQEIDSQSFTLVHEIEQQIDRTKSTDTDSSISYIFNSILSELRFEVVSSAQQTFELVPNGNQIPITAENFKEYSFHYRQYRLTEFHRQIEYIRQGFHSVVSCYFLNLLTASQLEEAVCGKGSIDVELLKRNTIYGHGFNQSSPVIERFWKVMGEMFTEEQKKMLLVFAWGRSTLPIRDEDFTSKFTICKGDVESGNVDQALPQSHTCSFAIDLPEYSTAEIMCERLDYAITHCSSIDGDGNMNVATTNHNDDSGSDDG